MSGDKLFQRIPDKERSVLRLFQSQPRKKIGLLVRELGLEVRLVSLPQSESGSLEFDVLGSSESGWVINVNKNHPPERQRFTVAHELAHYFLHKKDIDADPFFEPQKRAGRPNKWPYLESEEREEREANAFAAALLMDPLVTELVAKRYCGNVQRVADHFWVSQKVAEIRMRSLNLRGKV